MKKRITLYFISFFFVTNLLSQTCAVSVDALKGQYTGDCKKGKAEGTGTATGIDSYTGNFKNGYPDGQGKYIWKNGSWYEGSWKNGLFEGQGTLSNADSARSGAAGLITGFWKKGKYAGRNEKPYMIRLTTNNVSDINVRKLNGTGSDITVVIRNITGGGSDVGNVQLPKARIIDIQTVEGRFEQEAPDESSSSVSNKYTFRKVTYPFYAIFSIETPNSKRPTDKVGVEFFESCNWYVQLNIDN